MTRRLQLFKRWVMTILILLAAVIAFVLYRSPPPITQHAVESQPQQTKKQVDDIKNVKLEAETILSGLRNPWDVAFLPDGMMIFTERAGELSKVVDGRKVTIHQIDDVVAQGEGGLTGMTLDNDFADNRYLYTCYNSSHGDVRVVRWKLDNEIKSVSDKTPIATGIPSNPSGRHSGCRIKSAHDGMLWVGTGDAAESSHPQDRSSLGGKLLRITRDGKAPGDVKATGSDARIFSYGHRNVQGIALFSTPVGGVYGYSIEHGSDVDDEINLIRSGNFGWDPRPPYDESVPMTDKDKFPKAIEAIWSSGDSTIAPSGGDIINGKIWGQYDGALAMAVLKDEHLRILRFDADDSYKLKTEEVHFSREFGRLRSASMGSDGNLYLTTDNSIDDKIIKVKPIAK